MIFHAYYTRYKNWQTSTSSPALAPVDFLTPGNWAALPCKILVALPYKFFFSPEYERVVCFKRLGAVRSKADRLRIRPEATLFAGQLRKIFKKVEFLLVWISNAQDARKLSEEVLWLEFSDISLSLFLALPTLPVNSIVKYFVHHAFSTSGGFICHL